MSDLVEAGKTASTLEMDLGLLDKTVEQWLSNNGVPPRSEIDPIAGTNWLKKDPSADSEA